MSKYNFIQKGNFMKSKCSNCGQEFEGDLNFCPKCGKPIETGNKTVTCPKCGYSYESDYSFCPKCGTPKEQVKKTINEPVNKQVAAPIAKPIKEELVLEEKVKPEVFKEEKKVEKVQPVKIEKEIEEKPIVIAKDTTSPSLQNTNNDKEFLSNLETKLTKYLNIRIFGNVIYLIANVLFLFVPTIYFNVKIDDKIEQIYYSSFDYSIIALKEMIEQFKTTLNYAVFFDFIFIIASLSFISFIYYAIKFIVKAFMNRKNISKFANDKYKFTNKYLDTSSMDEYVNKNKFDQQNGDKDKTGQSLFFWFIVGPYITFALYIMLYFISSGHISFTIIIPSVFIVIYFIVGCTQRILMKKINIEIYDYKDYKSGKKKVNR